MQDVHTKLNPGLSWQKRHSTRKWFFTPENWIKFKAEINGVLHLVHSFEQYWKFDTSERRSEIPGQFLNVVLEKDGEDQLDRSCEEWNRDKEQRNIVYKIKRRKANWIGHILCGNCLLQHITERKIEGRSNGKTGKKIQAAAGWLQRNDRIAEIAKVTPRLHSAEKSLWKRLWACRKTEYLMISWPAVTRTLNLCRDTHFEQREDEWYGVNWTHKTQTILM